VVIIVTLMFIFSVFLYYADWKNPVGEVRDQTGSVPRSLWIT
jgi:hypothetical protein